MGASLLVPVALLCQAASVPAQIRFRPANEDSGVGFTLRHAPTERKRMIETMAGGLAVFDYDGDGLQDIYFTNGAAGEGMRKESPEYSNRLFRNLGGMRFEDVTEAAGVAGRGYSMGAATADFDNDGHADLFVAGVFQNTLFRNLGDGTFEDITAGRGFPARIGPWRRGGSITTTTGGQISSWSTTPTGRRTSTDIAATGSAAYGSIAIRSTSLPSRIACTATSAPVDSSRLASASA